MVSGLANVGRSEVRVNELADGSFGRAKGFLDGDGPVDWIMSGRRVVMSLSPTSKSCAGRALLMIPSLCSNPSAGRCTSGPCRICGRTAPWKPISLGVLGQDEINGASSLVLIPTRSTLHRTGWKSSRVLRGKRDVLILYSARALDNSASLRCCLSYRLFRVTRPCASR